jgi:hypothetical protein
MTAAEEWIPKIDTSVAHPARRYDYWLGGKDNFEADRRSGDDVAAAFPSVRTAAVENRRFLRRAVTFLTGEVGVRQFLDIGTGIPSANNTHEVAQSIAPQSRIVYVDNDPIVLVHARALLTSSPDGRTAYLDADLREPARILADPQLGDTLDLSQPIALMLVSIVHFLLDADEPHAKVAELVAALPPGSHLVLSHATGDFMDPELRERLDRINANNQVPSQFRAKDEIARFAAGLELVPPGIVPIPQWRDEQEPLPRPAAGDVAGYALVARVP